MNYIGSKKTLLDFVANTITEKTGVFVNPPVFADLFAGTGVVGSYFKEKGFSVISNDIQYYSYVLNRHNIGNTTDLMSTDLSLESHLNSLSPSEGFIYNNYCAGSGSGRMYFSDENGKKCDAIRIEIERLYSNKEITEDVYYWLLASLIETIDKYANTASVYGAFLKNYKVAALKDFKFKLAPIVQGPKGSVYNKDALELIKEIKGDVLYIDPPYNGRQYCSNYHVLETIALYDSPSLKGVTGTRDEDDKKSTFCSKRAVESSLEELIMDADFPYIFMSYSTDGILTQDKIQEIMSKYGDYSLATHDYKKFKADTSDKRHYSDKNPVECLHCLKKK